MKTRGKGLGVRALVLAVVIGIAWQYAHWSWDEQWMAEGMVMGWEQRPYVYRALVPALARGLMSLGLDAGTALSIVMVVSAVVLVYGIVFLFKSVR